VVLLAYPVMDVGVLFVVFTALLAAGARRALDTLIAASMTAMLIADLAFDVMQQNGTYQNGNVIDAGWLLSYVLLAAAALHPAQTIPLAMPDVSEQSRHNWMPVVASAALISPVLLLWAGLNDHSVDLPVQAAIAVTIVVLIGLRMTSMFGRLQRQTRELRIRTGALKDALLASDKLESDLRHLAFHDHLTGLANRSLLNDRMEHALARASRSGDGIAVLLCDLDGGGGARSRHGRPARR
jgi:hypothetical protein